MIGCQFLAITWLDTRFESGLDCGALCAVPCGFKNISKKSCAIGRGWMASVDPAVNGVREVGTKRLLRAMIGSGSRHADCKASEAETC